MAVVKSSKVVMAAAVKPVVLPLQYATPVSDFNRFDLLIYGDKKVGKTTLALQAAEGEKVLLLEFDPEQTSYKRLEVNFVKMSWKDVLAYLEALEKAAAQPGKFPYVRVVVDRVDIMFRKCQKAVCEKLCVDHPSEEPWGKGWDALRSAFTDVVDRFMNLPCGVWFICHGEWAETETRDSRKIMRLVPNLPGQAEEILNGKCEGWFAYDYYQRKRVLIVQGDEKVGAGHRLDEKGNRHFRTTGGTLLREVPMGTSPEEAYQNLLKAYNNRQTFVAMKDLEKGAATPSKK